MMLTLSILALVAGGGLMAFMYHASLVKAQAAIEADMAFIKPKVAPVLAEAKAIEVKVVASAASAASEVAKDVAPKAP